MENLLFLSKEEIAKLEDPIKIIILDMDGVVNSNSLIREWLDKKFKEKEKLFSDFEEIRKEVRKEYAKEFRNMRELIFPELAERITRICNETGAFILWSSTWRNLSEYQNLVVVRNMFKRRGLPEDRFIGYTPDLKGDRGWDYGWGVSRGEEISFWFKNYLTDRKIVGAVIDDRSDAGMGIPEFTKFFQTDEEYGITEKQTQEIISYLNKVD